MGISGRADNMGFALNQQEIYNQLLRYWVDFAHWSRALFSSTMYGLDLRETIEKRLIKNARDFADVIRTYYGEAVGQKFENIVADLYKNLFKMSDALHQGDMDQAGALNDAVYGDLDELTELIASLNPIVEKEELRASLYQLLYLTLEEAVMIYSSQYDESILQYDKIISQAGLIAQEMAYALINQLQYG